MRCKAMATKSRKQISNKEKIVLQREKALKYKTDRLGPGSLLTQQSHTNSSRLIMVNHNLPHFVSIYIIVIFEKYLFDLIVLRIHKPR